MQDVNRKNSEKKPLRILHLTDHLESGGAELLLLKSIEGFKKAFSLIQHYVMGIYTGGLLEKDFSKISNCSVLGFENGIVGFLKIIKLRKFILKNKINIVHTHLFYSMIIARFAIPKSVKLISTYHSPIYLRSNVFYSKLHLLIDRLTLRKKHILIFVSEAVRKNVTEVLNIKKNKNYVIPNFCDKRFHPTYQFNATSSLKLVSVGNLKVEKNYSLAIEALGILNNPAISLDIYGEGYDRKNLEELIKKYNLQNYVSLKGSEKITSELHANYDAFIMTSRFEGMPLALLEALASGMPAILNNLPELHESAESAGIYFDTHSSQSLAELLEKITNEKLLLKKLSEQALLVSKKYTIENYISQLEKLYYEN